MADSNSVLVRFLFLLTGRFAIGRCMTSVKALAPGYAAMTDEQILDACRRFIDFPKIPEAKRQEDRISLHQVTARRLGESDAEALAAACEAFSRFPPAGIPAGTRLFPEQIEAAAHLVRGSLVQMDTGEGKTFALMVAALTLLRVHPQVYIVTANPYLAMRDAANTAPFWAALGVPVGVALPEEYRTTGWPSWEATVVYTTVETLIFGCMSDDIAYQREQHRIRRGAVLVDEVDAILLDQLDTNFVFSRAVSGSDKDWHLACTVALALKRAHIERDPQDDVLRVRLTKAGQEEVIRLTGSLLDEWQHLGLYRDVELAYAGLRLAVEGRDYEIVDGTVVPVDPTSGWRTLTRIPDWVAPLSSHRRARSATWVQRTHLADGYSVLARFDHFAGASGTVIGEALEYLLIAGLPSAVIAPRRPRFRGGMKPDLTFASLEAVEQHLMGVVARESTRRPILIVTSSSVDAYRLAATLQRNAPYAISVRFAAGDTFGAQQLFEQAGAAGVVVVSTRQAGRGVDIQLSEQARRNGGSILILVGHSVQRRLDRQLIGRVGRGGDPFLAYFCNHPDDGLLNRIATMRTVRRLNPEGAMHVPWISRSIASFQRIFRYHQLQACAFHVATSQADAEVFEMLRRWRLLSQEHFDSWRMAEPFVRELVKTYLSYHVPGLNEPAVLDSQASAAARKVAELCGQPELATSLRLRITGQDAETARSVLAAVMTSALRQAQDANTEARHRYGRDESEAAHGISQDWLLAMRRRIDRLARDGDGELRLATHRVESTFTASAGTAAAAASTSIRSLVRQARAAEPAAPAFFDSMSFRSPQPWNQLEPLMVAVLSLRHGNVTPELLRSAASAVVRAEIAVLARRLINVTPEVLRSTASAAVEAERTFGPLASRAPALSRYRVVWNRSPAEIVSESITAVTDVIFDSRSRLWFDLSQRQLNSVRFQNAYAAGMQDVRKVSEALLADQVFRNLIRGADPLALDQLFAPRDKSVYAPVNPQLTVALASQFAPPPVSQSPVGSRDRNDVVMSFVAALEARKSWPRPWLRPPSREELLPALSSIMDESLAATLSSPEGVAEALDRWRRNPVRRRLLPWRRHQVDRAVRDFFGYLHEQGLSARLPSGVREHTLSLRHRIASRLLTPRMGMAAFLAAGTAAMAIALAAVHVHAPMRLTGLIHLADLCLAAGWYGAGLAVGPALLAVMGASFIKWLLRGDAGATEVRPGDRLVLFAIIIAAELWILLVPGMSWPRSVAVGLSLLVATLVLSNLVWTFENISQIYLTAGLIGAGILGIALPAVIRPQPARLALLVAGGVVLANIWRLIPIRMRIRSMQWGRLTSDDSESVPGWRNVTAHVDWRTHTYALAGSSLVGIASRNVAVVTPVVYLLIYAFLARLLARSVTDSARWSTQLRKANQAYLGTPRRPDLTAGLASLRRRMLGRELATGTVYVALAAVLGPQVRLFGGPVVQLGLVAGFLGIAGWELAATSVVSLRNIISLEIPGTDSRIGDDLSESVVTDIRDVLNRFAKRLSLIVIAYLALAKITEVLGVWGLLHDLADLIRRAF